MTTSAPADGMNLQLMLDARNRRRVHRTAWKPPTPTPPRKDQP